MVGRSVYGHVITKFSRMGSLPHFLTHGAPLRVLRARELRYDLLSKEFKKVKFLHTPAQVSILNWAKLYPKIKEKMVTLVCRQLTGM